MYVDAAEGGWHVKTKVRPLFPGFSHCACLPVLSNPRSSSSATAACPKNPSTCTRASLFIQKFSRQHFPLLRRHAALLTFYFCLLLPQPRGRSPPRHITSATAVTRLISSPHHSLFTTLHQPRHPHTLLQTSHKLSIDPDHHYHHHHHHHAKFT